MKNYDVVVVVQVLQVMLQPYVVSSWGWKLPAWISGWILIKDANYAYEKEYRLLCFANKKQVPNILQSQDITEQTESTKDTNTGKSTTYTYLHRDRSIKKTLQDNNRP